MGEMTHRQVADELKDLMVRAREGDEGALPKVREIFDEIPTLARKVMDPAKIAERSAVDLYATGDNLLAGEVMPRVLKQMRSELEGEHPTPLERLLVERCRP